MKTRITSIIIVLALLMCICAPAAAADYSRSGYSLTPVSYDGTGVMPDSLYILSGTSDAPQIMINDAISATVTPNGDGTFTVAPDAPLTYNKLYTFKLMGDNPVTWTFQTAEKFRVEKTLPGSYATDVPINSGIEITFSHSDVDFESVKNNFSIKPHVDGKWELHDKTAVFIPEKPFDYDTEYSVAISSKTARANGAALGEGCEFSFTTIKSSEQPDESDTYFYIQSDYYETSTSVAPIIPVGASVKGKTTASAKVSLYTVDRDDAEAYFLNDLTFKQLGEKRGNEIMSFDYTLNVSEDEGFKTQFIPFPSTLENGFYLAEISLNDKTRNALIQSTDIGAYIMKDSDRFLIWTNDMSTGEPLEGVKFSTRGSSGISDPSGIAYVNAPESEPYEDAVFSAELGDKTALFGIYDREINRRKYFTAMEFDRTLYMPDDTVNFWGAAKPTDGSNAPSSLTAEVQLSRRYYTNGENVTTPVSVTRIDCEDGVFSGSVNLPNLNAGSYALVIKNGEESIISKYFTVEEYVKPDYNISLTPDKRAIFYGHTINYKIKTEFFDGTPVSDLSVKFSADRSFFNNISETLFTDANGEAQISVTPTLEYSEWKNYSFSPSFNPGIYAKLPEIGDISASASTTVLMNDIKVNIDSEFKDGSSNIKLHSDLLTLDKVNSQTDGYIKIKDYIAAPDSGRALNAVINYNYYEATQYDTGYNYITKQSYPIYHYEYKTEKAAEFSVTTNENGDAEYLFTPPTDDKKGWYSIDISSADTAGRAYENLNNRINTKEYNTYISDSYSVDDYKIDCDKELYDIGENAVFTVTKGSEAADGRFLYVKDNNGIRDAAVLDSSVYTTTFDAVPSIFVSAVLFDPQTGYKYIGVSEAEYDIEKSRLNFEITTDKEEYAPGDDCGITVKVSDQNGAAAAADVNISVVDEALFKLSKYEADSLEQLYDSFYSKTSQIYRSHKMLEYAAPSPVGATSFETASGGGANAAADSSAESRIRSEFKDTAAFVNLKTDENGYAAAQIKLPDNITSWRATVSAITGDMKAGNGACPIKVTMPAFIKYNINKTFLAGDAPVLGVNLYGSGLGGDEDVTFTVYDGVQYKTAEGKPYERVNIPLDTNGALGERVLTVSAAVNGAVVDSVQTPIEIVDTYNTTQQAVEYSSPYEPLRPDPSGSDKSVRVIFSDESRASVLNDIYYMRYLCGERLDQKISMKTAMELLNKYYEYENEIPEIDWSAYQSEDGGIKLFTYGDSDPDATAKLTPFIKDDIDADKLAEYLSGIENSAKALYAEAALREPVLNEMDALSGADNLTAIDYLYLILAYCELGETDKAGKIYDERISGLVQYYGNMKRINAGNTRDEILEATAAAAVAAQRLGRGDARLLYDYTVANRTQDILINIERLMFVSAAAEALPSGGGKLSYELYGQTFETELTDGRCHTVIVPASFIPEFKVLEAADSIKMTAVYQTSLNIGEITSPDLTLSRSYGSAYTYENKTEFSQNDIVKVTLSVDFADTALGGRYIITDYLPSGLTPIVNGNRDTGSFSIYYGGGQTVQFYAYPNKENHWSASYYARVVSPGSYTADNATIQNEYTADFLAATDRDNIVINPW